MSDSSRSVTLAVRLLLGNSLIGAAAFAAEGTGTAPAASGEPDRLQTVVISALAVPEDARNVAASYSVLEGNRLIERGRATLGDTLDGLPGVHPDTFGGGAARPVIRGQTSPRVRVLSDGAGLLDASDISPDHVVTAEPLLFERIEVLRGPATLLYGSGATGGVVNVLDNKIPSRLPDRHVTGFAALRGDSVSGEESAAFGLTARATDNLALHFEGSARDANDYRVPDWEERRVAGTYSESATGSAGLSWITSRGHLGLAYSHRDDDYGVPGHDHEYEPCHPHGSALHCVGHGSGSDPGHDHGHEQEHEQPPSVDLLSKRFDLRGEYHEPFAGVERIRLRLGRTEYHHHEIDLEEISTTFRNEGYEGRIELAHAPIAGWRGVAGLQHARSEFIATGSEAFIPKTDSEMTGLFVVEHYELNDEWHFEAGVRQEWQTLEPVSDPRNRPKYSRSATSVSGATVWEFATDYSLALSLARSERLPHAQELYARGLHLATNTYECGMIPHPQTCGGLENNSPIDIETSNSAELTLRRRHDNLSFTLGSFFNRVDDYIYARTLDQFEAFRLIKHSQHDAEFRGLEGEATYRVSASLSATVFGDHVRAKLRDGGNLPRIPAARFGLRLNLAWQGVSSELEFYRVDEQDDIASYEAVTPGHEMLNVSIGYDLQSQGRYHLFLRARNLLDEQVWNHSSFLAQTVPLPGRSVSAGIRLML